MQVVTSVDPFGYYAAGVQQGLDDAFKPGGDGAQDNSPTAGAAPAALDRREGGGSGEHGGAPAPGPDAADGVAGAGADVGIPSEQGAESAAGPTSAADATANGGVHDASAAAAEDVHRGQEPEGAAAAGAHVERALADAAADEARCLLFMC